MFQSKLLRWFSKNARPLPWRRQYRPYDVWVSEIMLQQTQMDTVLPYFERWMKAFPTIQSLAEADESKVLKLWQGLGYYSRARNLHAAAQEIFKKYGGDFPSDFSEILAIKGIGRYTAGAIASIAFNQPKPIVDGNILRVLSRVYTLRQSIDTPKNRETYWNLQEKLIPNGSAREFNQALMELGALVCTPKNPQCGLCPLHPVCGARKDGNPQDYPVRSPRKKSVRVTALALALKRDRAYLLLRRPVGKIMGGLWEFPEWKMPHTKADVKSAVGMAKKNLGLALTGVQKVGQIKRSYTHHLETLHTYSAKSETGKIRLEQGWKSAWVKPQDFKNYPFSSAHAKIAALLTNL